ncbi:MAG: hypothetical protein Q7T05_07420 [Dehalococcoidia bacterium]|nr:hypothetical protein [Dehalococcoidia bacterium]
MDVNARKAATQIVCTGIAELPDIVESMPPENRHLFDRIFDLNAVTGYLDPPPEMIPWIEKQFGPISGVVEQKITRITNKITFEGALYNRLRASRPIEMIEKLSIQASIIDNARNDPLHDPLKMTPEDAFGRIQGKYCVTASNIAKYDGFHGLVIFENPNPLSFDREHVHDYMDTAWRWAQRAHRFDPESKYYLFIWNCLRRAGASLLHGHAQMTLSRKSHYAKVEQLRQGALRYKEQYDTNYFDDLFRVHDMLGLALENDGVRTMAYLTPIKEKEIMVLAPEYGDHLKDAVYEMLSALRDAMNVTSFNLAMYMPPLAETPESWEGFPVIARAVDRGQPKSASCDIGTMELYAASVISSDPFQTARLLMDKDWRTLYQET